MIPPIITDIGTLFLYKELWVFPTHLHYHVDVPAGETIEALLEVPENYVYLVPGEVHSVKDGVFEHECKKDGFPVLPKTLITGSTQVISYAQPITVREYWHGKVRNTSAATEKFDLRVPYLSMPVETADELLTIAQFLHELMLIIAKAWTELDSGTKECIARRILEERPETLSALMR